MAGARRAARVLIATGFAAAVAAAGLAGVARAAGPAETLTLPATSDQATTSRPLDARHEYLLTVSGTIGVHAGVASECDALFCFAGKVTGPAANLRVNKEGQSIAQVGSCPAKKVTYSRKHTYAYRVVGVSGPLRFFFADAPGGFADNSGGWSITIADLGEGTGECGVRWPPHPDALIPLATVANGCGPSSHATADERYADTGVYTSSLETAERFTVSFRAACDQHDAGYSHAKVRDMPLNGGGIIDYFGWNQAQIDTKFLRDMLKLCNVAIPARLPLTRRNCAAGARLRYSIVFAAGSLVAYEEAPSLTGSWFGQTGQEPLVGDGWVVQQQGRSVTATWKDREEKGKTGEFRGWIISGDGSSTVTGHYITTTGDGVSTTPAPLSFTCRAAAPRRLVGSSGLSLAR